jgi:hypothetical protein
MLSPPAYAMLNRTGKLLGGETGDHHPAPLLNRRNDG